MNIYNYTTMKELCEHSRSYISDEHYCKFGSFKKCHNDEFETNMYELRDEKYRFIKNYLIKYNNLGFFTTMSHPGMIKQFTPFKTNHISKTFNFCDIQSISNNKFNIKQTACVGGYIDIKTGMKLFDYFKGSAYIKCKLDYFAPSNDTNMAYIIATYDGDEKVDHTKIPGGFAKTERMSGFNMELLRACAPKLENFNMITPIIIYDIRYGYNDLLWKEILACLETEREYLDCDNVLIDQKQ